MKKKIEDMSLAEAEQLRKKLVRLSEKFGVDERRTAELKRLDRRIKAQRRFATIP